MKEEYPFPLQEVAISFADAEYKILYYSVPQHRFGQCNVCGKKEIMLHAFLVIVALHDQKYPEKNIADNPESTHAQYILEAFLQTQPPTRCDSCKWLLN